jgi:hypothetical protein
LANRRIIPMSKCGPIEQSVGPSLVNQALSGPSVEQSTHRHDVVDDEAQEDPDVDGQICATQAGTISVVFLTIMIIIRIIIIIIIIITKVDDEAEEDADVDRQVCATREGTISVVFLTIMMMIIIIIIILLLLLLIIIIIIINIIIPRRHHHGVLLLLSKGPLYAAPSQCYSMPIFLCSSKSMRVCDKRTCESDQLAAHVGGHDLRCNAHGTQRVTSVSNDLFRPSDVVGHVQVTQLTS